MFKHLWPIDCGFWEVGLSYVVYHAMFLLKFVWGHRNFAEPHETWYDLKPEVHKIPPHDLLWSHSSKYSKFSKDLHNFVALPQLWLYDNDSNQNFVVLETLLPQIYCTCIFMQSFFFFFMNQGNCVCFVFAFTVVICNTFVSVQGIKMYLDLLKSV